MLAEFPFEILTSPFGWLSLMVVGWAITGVVGSIMSNWRKVREAEQSAALKQSLVDKGMSAADIERVLNAGKSSKA